MAECPANQLGTSRTVQTGGTIVLDNIYNNNWAMYAGVEFGNNEYRKSADSIKVIASSVADGGVYGNHDVYLLFTGSGTNKLFMMQSFYFTGKKVTTGTSGENFHGPRKYDLEQNFPNPFNPTTEIGYQLPVASNISLKVFNLLGQEITTLYEGFHQSGNYTTKFDAEGLSSGIYLYRLEAGNFVFTKKALLLK